MFYEIIPIDFKVRFNLQSNHFLYVISLGTHWLLYETNYAKDTWILPWHLKYIINLKKRMSRIKTTVHMFSSKVLAIG